MSRNGDAAVSGPDEAAVQAIGERIIDRLPSGTRSPPRILEERMMNRLARAPEAKAALFRLVDVAPMCRSNAELSDHLGALIAEVPEPSRPIRMTGRLASRPVARGAVGASAARAVRLMAGRFIVGTDVDDALPELFRLWKGGVASTVDLLGEATVTEAEADAYAARCRQALESLAARTAVWPGEPRWASDAHGALPRVNLSIKVSALTPEARPDAPARGAESARGRLRSLLAVARDLGAHLHIDMESLDLRETVTQLVREVLAEPEFAREPSTGIVLQAYLRDSPAELESWLEWVAASRPGSPLTARLVKGAYWDHEVVEAGQAGWSVPVFEDRASCDRNFEALTRQLLQATDLVRPAIASHNVRSLAHAIAAAEAAGVSGALELQVLRGLGGDVQDALARLGFRVRAYCPVGDLVEGMAYLVRRLLENTSNDSFLRISASTQDVRSLLVPP